MARARAAWLAVAGVALLLRGSGIAWDDWQLQHPDERFLVMVAERLAAPRSLAEALDPARTPLNPNNAGFSFYVYGALPPALFRGGAAALGGNDLEGLLRAGRFITVLADCVTLLLVVLLAARLGGRRAGTVAGALYACTALAIQQSRYATVDAWGTLAVVAAAWLVVGRPVAPARAAAAGAAVGLALACKPNLALALAIPLAWVAQALWRRAGDDPRAVRRSLVALAAVVAGAAVAAKLADPGAFASLWSLLPSPRRLAALDELRGILDGRGQYPPNLQWADRRAVLEPLANLLFWGVGPALGAAMAVGLGRVARRAALGGGAWVPVLAWLIPAAGWHLTRFVCSVRHLETFVPFGVVAAALWLTRRRRTALAAVVVATTALWGVAWASLAWRPHTRIEASHWLASHLPAGSLVTAEYWDDALPLPGAVGPWIGNETMRVFDPDTPAKREAMLATLDKVDAVVLASQRGVGSICRVPDGYPLTAEYYHLLFSEALGFDLAASFTRGIGVAGWGLCDLGAEETLSVYDHPPVWVFRKSARYSTATARRLLERVPLRGPAGWDTAALEARGQAPYLEAAPGRGGLPGPLRSGGLRQLAALLAWCLGVEVLALAGARLARRLAPGLPDGGFGVGRVLGLALAGCAFLWLGWLRVPGWNVWLPSVALLAALPWAARELARVHRERGFRLVELAFWGTFAVFLAVRAWNPEIYWGEKPMDAAILGGLLRADALPPVDPWYAGSPLNYYFVGFLPHALLARAGAIPPGVAFNLAAATVPALVVACAITVGWLLSRRAAAGLLAAALTQLVGTAGVLFHPLLLTAPGFDEFWATSRVIPDAINEYPVWTALFADLHAHFLSFPGFLAAVAAATAVALGALRGRAAPLAMGALVALQAMTNTWEVPLLALLAVAARLASGPQLRSWRGVVAHGRWLVAAAATAVVVSAPYWTAVRTAGGDLELNRAPAPSAAALLELFGIVGGLLLVGLAAAAAARRGGREIGWTLVVALAGVAAVVVPEFVTVADRMNTVFKFHLQAQLLLGLAAAALLGGTFAALGRRWRVAVLAGALPLLAVGALTSIADARAVIATRRVAGPRPTLDGAAYLAAATPHQAAVLAALAARDGGGVVAEPLGPPYSDTLRVPMFAGHAAVVGWEYHLWQRRNAWYDIAMRQEDLDLLLQGGDDATVAALARRYSLSLACSWRGRDPAVARAPGWTELARDGTAAAFARGGER